MKNSKLKWQFLSVSIIRDCLSIRKTGSHSNFQFLFIKRINEYIALHLYLNISKLLFDNWTSFELQTAFKYQIFFYKTEYPQNFNIFPVLNMFSVRNVIYLLSCWWSASFFVRRPASDWSSYRSRCRRDRQHRYRQLEKNEMKTLHLFD
jgi:hypothetical protein